MRKSFILTGPSSFVTKGTIAGWIRSKMRSASVYTQAVIVKFEEEEKKKETPKLDIPLDELSTVIGKEEAQAEEERYKPTEEDLEELKRQLQKFEQVSEEPREEKIKRLSYSKRDA